MLTRIMMIMMMMMMTTMLPTSRMHTYVHGTFYLRASEYPATKEGRAADKRSFQREIH